MIDTNNKSTAEDEMRIHLFGLRDYDGFATANRYFLHGVVVGVAALAVVFITPHTSDEQAISIRRVVCNLIAKTKKAPM